MTRRRAIGLAIGAVTLAVATYAGVRWIKPASTITSGSTTIVPSARVTRATLTLTVRLQGDVRATRQAAVTAPAVGGMLRVLSLVPERETLESWFVRLTGDQTARPTSSGSEVFS